MHHDSAHCASCPSHNRCGIHEAPSDKESAIRRYATLFMIGLEPVMCQGPAGDYHICYDVSLDRPRAELATASY